MRMAKEGGSLVLRTDRHLNTEHRWYEAYTISIRLWMPDGKLKRVYSTRTGPHLMIYSTQVKFKEPLLISQLLLINNP